MSGEPANRTGDGAGEPANRTGGDGSGDERGRRLIDRARKAAPAPPRRRKRPVPPDEQRWSGAGSDERDPALLSASIDKLVGDRDWEDTLRKAGIPARWPQLVGAEIADHCRPERLEAGVLTCVAESTAWATQIRLLAPTILSRLRAELGGGVVAQLRVHGPTAPDWRHGPLRVTGRGPRDTYG